MNIFFCEGYEDFVDMILGSSQNWTSFRGTSMYFGSLVMVKVQNGDIFGVAKISNIFRGA